MPLARAGTSELVWMEVTAYCPCKICCGRKASGVTASGKPVSHNRGRFVAADKSVLPFHTLVSVPGYHEGTPVPVIDTGSAITGNRLDVFFRSHQAATEWGRKMLRVRVTQR
jgi:3D (Asp-Asp-Asp) domain-containing protein